MDTPRSYPLQPKEDTTGDRDDGEGPGSVLVAEAASASSIHCRDGRDLIQAASQPHGNRTNLPCHQHSLHQPTPTPCQSPHYGNPNIPHCMKSWQSPSQRGLVSSLAVSAAQELVLGEHQRIIATKATLPAPSLRERRAAA